MLKKLAQEGRTIVCTIHQPSALVFKMFDHLFAVAEGRCIYTGGTENLIPFLFELDLKCPEFHNPSDYLLEVSTNDFGPQNDRLVEKTENGLCSDYQNRRDRPSTAQMAALSKVGELESEEAQLRDSIVLIIIMKITITEYLCVSISLSYQRK